MRKKNIFVIGLDQANLHAVKQVARAGDYRFHPLLSYDECYEPESVDFTGLLETSRETLRGFDGEVDALITHWDFPCTTLLAALAGEWGLPAPSLEAMLRCEHKYWGRKVQHEVVPECTPSFAPVNPFDPPEITDFPLSFPFWIKPVKGFASQLGFYIGNGEAFEKALERIRGGIGRLGRGFNQAMDLARIPDDILPVDGMWCIAEEIIDGAEIAPEGYVCNGEMASHGLIDCVRDQNGKSFHRWEYPSTCDPHIQDRIEETTRRLMRGLDYHRGCFNIEFLHDESSGKLWVVEVNPRISQSHSYQFERVNGVSNHEVALQVALGESPALPPGGGGYQCAAKCVLRLFNRARVVRVPTEEEIREVEAAFPDCQIQVLVEEGRELDTLPKQDVYSFALAHIFVAGRDQREMLERYDGIVDRLKFEFEHERPIDVPEEKT